MAAVEQDGFSLHYASENMRATRDIVLAAVSKNGCALKDVVGPLRHDETVVLAAVATYPHIFPDLDENFQDNKAVVLTVVRQMADKLKYASERLRGDREVVLTALQNRWTASQVIEHVTEPLKSELVHALDAGLSLDEYASIELELSKRSEEEWEELMNAPCTNGK